MFKFHESYVVGTMRPNIATPATFATYRPSNRDILPLEQVVRKKSSACCVLRSLRGSNIAGFRNSKRSTIPVPIPMTVTKISSGRLSPLKRYSGSVSAIPKTRLKKLVGLIKNDEMAALERELRRLMGI